jgi:chromosome segregation ATPase
MSDPSNAMKSLRERLAGAGEDHLAKALTELLDSPLLTGTIGRASTAREKAAQAQELAMGAFNIPSAADIERLTRRLRSVSQRLEGIEDGMHRLDRALASRGADSSQIGARLSKIEEQLGTLTSRLGERASRSPSPAPRRDAKPKASKAKRKTG